MLLAYRRREMWMQRAGVCIERAHMLGVESIWFVTTPIVDQHSRRDGCLHIPADINAPNATTRRSVHN